MAKLNKKLSGRFRGGYAIIILLIVIGLGVLLFVLQKAGMFNPRPKDPNAPGIMPWEEWESRQMAESESETPPLLGLATSRMEFDGNLTLAGSDEPRGEIKLYIGEQTVGGQWHGYYHKGPKLQYDITGAGFSGRFYPDKKYVDEDGNEDATQRYFLCKGEFQMQETGKQIVRILAGEIYVRGWVGEDNIISGSVFITSNYKDYKEFEFKGRVR